MARSSGDVHQVVPTILGLLLLVGGVILAASLVVDLVPRARSFPDNHGVGVEAPFWLRCVSETIERHPWPFTTGDFRLTQAGHRQLVIEGTFRSTDVTVVEGNIVYWGWRGHEYAPMQCPDAAAADYPQLSEPALKGA